MSYPKKGCFKCGNVGHFASACTETERLCYNCKQTGHESNSCDLPRTVESKQCYTCGGVGHIQADCPSIRVARNSGNASAGRCYNCGMFGHLARNCRNQPRYNGPPSTRNFGANRSTFGANGAGSGSGAHNGRVFCYKCGGANHFSRDCKANDVKCYNCNGFGHLSKNCSEAPKSRACYKCQEEGHISRDCPQA